MNLCSLCFALPRVVGLLNLNRNKKIVRREPRRDGKILSDHRQDGNDEVHRLKVRSLALDGDLRSHWCALALGGPWYVTWREKKYRFR